MYLAQIISVLMYEVLYTVYSQVITPRHEEGADVSNCFYN